MNQLKSQETRIRQVHRAAEEFATLEASAKHTLSEISEVARAADAQGTSLRATAEDIAGILARVTEQGQKVSGVAGQVEQYGTTVTQLLANSKQASADTEAIAKRSKELQAEMDSSRTTLQDLTSKAQELLTSTQASATSQLSEFKGRYDELAVNTQAAISASASRLDTSVTDLNTALNSKTDAAAAAVQRMGTDLDTKVTKLISDTSLRLTQAEAAQDQKLATQLKEFGDNSQKQLASQADAFNAQVAGQASQADQSIRTAETEYKRLVDQLQALEDQIRVSIERATGHSLFHSFQKRQLDIAKAKDFWAWALLASVLVSLTASGVFIYSLRFVQVYNAAFYLKLSISLPLIYAIAFCNVQYSRERRLEEEYAFKSNISISLDPYQRLVGELVDKNKPEELSKYTAFIIDSVTKVFTSPTGHIFEAPGDRSSGEKLIKALGDFIEPLLKVLKK
jgi:hypothetical protein